MKANPENMYCWEIQKTKLDEFAIIIKRLHLAAFLFALSIISSRYFPPKG